MGHNEDVPPEEKDTGYENHSYIPRHAVSKDSSTTTKLIVVFDGSANTTTVVLVNSTLMTGPMLQPHIFDLLIRFRSYKFGMTADVANMYRQIALVKESRSFQRLL